MAIKSNESILIFKTHDSQKKRSKEQVASVDGVIFQERERERVTYGELLNISLPNFRSLNLV